MLQLPFPARQSDCQLAEAPALPARPRARLFIKRQLQKLRQAAHERFEGTLWRVASLGLVANLILLPQRFWPSSLAIGNASKFRFWRPASLGECFDLLLAVLIWPGGMPVAALLFTARNGAVVEQRFGVARRRQLTSQLCLV